MIYAGNISQLTLIIMAVLLVWYFMLRFSRICRTIAVFGLIASIYAVLYFTVLGRAPSDEHAFVFSAAYTNEYFREMFMNMLLYIPLGMTLSVLIGVKAILVCVILSISIESWQYFTGTGLAQATDVIMNSLGTLIGTLPYAVTRIMERKRNSKANHDNTSS